MASSSLAKGDSLAEPTDAATGVLGADVLPTLPVVDTCNAGKVGGLARRWLCSVQPSKTGVISLSLCGLSGEPFLLPPLPTLPTLPRLARLPLEPLLFLRMFRRLLESAVPSTFSNEKTARFFVFKELVRFRLALPICPTSMSSLVVTLQLPLFFELDLLRILLILPSVARTTRSISSSNARTNTYSQNN